MHLFLLTKYVFLMAIYLYFVRILFQKYFPNIFAYEKTTGKRPTFKTYD